jgi:hypothetical protein
VPYVQGELGVALERGQSADAPLVIPILSMTHLKVGCRATQPLLLRERFHGMTNTTDKSSGFVVRRMSEHTDTS